MKGRNTFWLVIVILVALGILIYILSLGEINVISDAEHAEAEKRKLAEERYKILEGKMIVDLPRKKKLDFFVSLGFIAFKVLMFGLLLGALVGLKNIFHLKSWAEVFEFGAKVWGCFAFVILFFAGIELKFVRYYKYMRNLIKTWVYRKYGNLENEIEQNRQEMDQLENYLGTETLTRISILQKDQDKLNEDNQ